MTWWIPISLRIITAHGVAPVLLKLITGLPARFKRLGLQFFMCAIFAYIFSAVFDQVIFYSNSWILIFSIGIINSWAAYCQWRAIDLNLAKTSLFTQADDFIAVTLGYIILNEAHYLNPLLFLGVILCFAGAMLIGIQKSKNLILLAWVLGYSLIWGLAVFLMRYFALSGVNTANFLTAWYSGSFVGIIVLVVILKVLYHILSALGLNNTALKIYSNLNKDLTGVIGFNGFLGISILSTVIFAAMLFGYWGATLAPITVFQPIYLITEMIFPALIGLYLFHERKHLTKMEKIAFPVGLFGGIVIAISY